MDVEKKKNKLAKVNAAIDKLKAQRDKIERELEGTDISVWDKKFAGKMLAIHEHTMTKLYNASTRIIGSTTYARVIRCISHDRFGHIKVEVYGDVFVDISKDGTAILQYNSSVHELTIHEVDLEKKFVEVVSTDAALAHVANAEASARTIATRMREILKERT